LPRKTPVRWFSVIAPSCALSRQNGIAPTVIPGIAPVILSIDPVILSIDPVILSIDPVILSLSKGLSFRKTRLHIRHPELVEGPLVPAQPGLPHRNHVVNPPPRSRMIPP
jgi:hypothetical protein